MCLDNAELQGNNLEQNLHLGNLAANVEGSEIENTNLLRDLSYGHKLYTKFI